MSEIERLYFLVEGGPVLEALEAAAKRAQETYDKRMEFMREFKAKGVWASDRSIVGLVFAKKDDIPTGWRFKAGHWEGEGTVVAVPDKRTKAGREVAKRKVFQDGLWQMDAFYDLMDRAYVPMSDSRSPSGMSLASPGAEKIGGRWVVSVPDNGEPYTPPEGLRPLKMSEYWQIKEAA